jgi:hypothetical protein
MIVGHVIIANTWRTGKIKAIARLGQSNILFDLAHALSEDGVDFLCPHGGKVEGA